MKYILGLILLFSAFYTNADVFENTSKNAGVTYSDTPTPGSQQVDIPANDTNSTPPLVVGTIKKIKPEKGTIHYVSGTGFFVNKMYVVTNAHVVRGCSKVIIKGAVPERTADVAVIDEDDDLALIETMHPPQNLAPLRFNIDDLKVGDKLYILGFPGYQGAQGEYHFVEATVLNPHINRLGRFYISDVLLHGNSGGPVLDQFGNVIGVVVATAVFTNPNNNAEEAHAGVVISLNTLKEFLRHHGISAEWSATRAQYDSDAIEDNAKDYIVNVQCRS